MRKLKVDPSESKPESPPPPPESAAEVSKKLDRALTNGDREDRLSAARDNIFDNPHRPKYVDMPFPMKKIIEVEMGDGDDGELMVKELRELEAELDSSNKPGRQVELLEKAEHYARRAFHLLSKYKQMAFIWEKDNEMHFASTWYEATKFLQHEKDNGKRSKQITDKDVEMACAAIFPDQWRDNEIKKFRAKQALESVEHLVEAWSMKCRDLQALVAKGR